MIKYQTAIELIDNYNWQQTIESRNIFDCLGYSLASDIQSPINVPSFRRSSMDGYAVLKDDLNTTTSFEIAQIVAAGDSFPQELKPGQCARVLTGAAVPANSDLVIVQELATVTDKTVTFAIPKTKLNANICEIGEDIKLGDKLFSARHILKPTDISSLVSIGCDQVQVYGRPKLLLITTGNEVIKPGNELLPGQIYNTNLAYIKTRLAQFGYQLDTVHITDSIDDFEQQIKKSIYYDLVLTTGAISVGDKDIIRHFAEAKATNIIFDRINIMPGGPCVMWEFNSTPIISLAGSPYANFVTFELLALRAISLIANDSRLIPIKQTLPLTDSYCKDIKKMRFIKAKANGSSVSLPASNHLASSMFEMCLCNTLIVAERGKVDWRPGTEVTVLKLGGYNE